MKEFLIYLLATANIVSLLHLGFFLTGANIYDVKKLRALRADGALKKRALRPYRPLISVVVPAHNEQTGIIRTLDSLLLSDYENMEIIVVNDGSTDLTAQVTERYMRRLSARQHTTYMARSGRNGALVRRSMVGPTATKPPITLVNQPNGGKGSAVNNGIKNHAKGTLIMTLDADSLVDRKTLSNAVAYFRDLRVVGVAANVRIMGKGWLGSLQRFEHMIGYRSKKFYTVTNSEFIVGGVASTYRKSVLRKVGYYDTDTQTEDIGLSMKIVAKLGNRDKRIIYASDVVAMTEGVQSYRGLMKQRYRWKLGSLQNLYKFRHLIFRGRDKTYSKMLTLYRLPVALLGESLLILEPLMMSYIIYLSISRHSIAIFLGAYLTITAYTLWTIWPDELMTPRQKLRMSFSAFAVYLLFYAMTLVQLVAIYRCVKNFRKVVDLSRSTNTWTSPERSATLQTAV